MPTRRVIIRQVREIVRLSLEAGLSTRVVGKRVGVGPTTVRDTVKRFVRADLAWPVPEAISHTELEQLLYGVPGVMPGRRKVAELTGPLLPARSSASM
ncbi:transposase-like protein [Bradyrhizobium sp. USDA 4011]